MDRKNSEVVGTRTVRQTVMKTWQIIIYCGHEQIGKPIPAEMWDVLSKLANVNVAVRPLGWNAEAYPVIH